MILQNTQALPYPPSRIVSLVPSQTELLYALGLEKETIGITKFCVHPQSWRNTKTIVGGTKNLRLETIASLQPDLIIANKEENNKADIEYLAETFSVWVTDVKNVTTAMAMIADLGYLTGSIDSANRILSEIKKEKEKLLQQVSVYPRKKVCYLIWKAPFMSVGADTFIHDILQHGGWDNVFSDQQRYPTLTIDQIKERSPDYIFLSSEPYPFSESHREELSTLFPASTVVCVDGEMCSWYGSRMILAFPYLASLHQKLSSK